MHEILMPRMDAEIGEARIINWFKREGDKVKKGETLAEVETEKVVFELEADRSGILKKILAKPGDVVQVGKPVAIIEDEGKQTG